MKKPFEISLVCVRVRPELRIFRSFRTTRSLFPVRFAGLPFKRVCQFCCGEGKNCTDVYTYNYNYKVQYFRAQSQRRYIMCKVHGEDVRVRMPKRT